MFTLKTECTTIDLWKFGVGFHRFVLSTSFFTLLSFRISVSIGYQFLFLFILRSCAYSKSLFSPFVFRFPFHICDVFYLLLPNAVFAVLSRPLSLSPFPPCYHHQHHHYYCYLCLFEPIFLCLLTSCK